LKAYTFTEVAQQSRIRHKEDFIIAFSPVMAEATAAAYKGAPTDVQTKIRRVVDVWRDRTIFERPIQEAIDSRLNGTFAKAHCKAIALIEHHRT
jgi:regulator of Ty1 transposition protein 103